MSEVEQMDEIEAGGRSLFEAEDLPFPPMPAALEKQLEPIGDHIFATRPLHVQPYDLAEAAAAVLEDVSAGEDYALVGMDGHGVNSWAAHYFIVQPGLALFLQLPWGGIYMDAEKARDRIRAAFGWAAEVQDKVSEATAVSAPKRRLVAMVSDLRGSHWGFSEGADGRIAWRDVESLREDIAGAIAAMRGNPDA